MAHKLKKADIGIIGDLMVDINTYGTADRISQEAPVQILDIKSEERFLGGAGNVAFTVSNLGGLARFYSVIGSDAIGNSVCELLNNTNIDGYFATENNRKTTVKNRLFATERCFQMLLRTDNETRSDIAHKTEDYLFGLIQKRFESQKPDFVVISDYNKGLLTHSLIQKVMKLNQKYGIKTVVDTKQSMSLYHGADYLVPNAKELCFQYATKDGNDDGVIIPLGQRLAKEMNSIVVIKRSEKGATIIGNQQVRSLPALSHNITNTSGAGDIFVAVMTMCLASDYTLDRAVEIANIACSKAIVKRHPSISASELDDIN